MASRPHISPLGVVLVLGAGCLWPLAVEAAILTTTPAVGFDNSASITDSEGGGAMIGTNVSLGSSSVAQFNSALGVLTGATLGLTSTRTQTVWAKATAGGGTGANSDVTTTGWGSSTAVITAPGVDASFGAISATDSCAGKRKHECTGTATSSAPTTTNLAAGIPGSSLDDYVGSGAATVARSVPTLAADHLASAYTGTETTTSTVNWAGTVRATYEYLLHAAPSFKGDTDLVTLHIDFGDVLKGSSASLAFEIFNLAAFDRVGLDLDSIVGSGDVTALLTDLSAFAGLQPGDSYGYWATLDASTIGQFAATYLLSFSDADVGATASRYGYQLVLNLSGNVVNPVTREIEPRNNVPEPATLALFTLGIATLPLVRRRRTPS